MSDDDERKLAEATARIDAYVERLRGRVGEYQSFWASLTPEQEAALKVADSGASCGDWPPGTRREHRRAAVLFLRHWWAQANKRERVWLAEYLERKKGETR